MSPQWPWKIVIEIAFWTPLSENLKSMWHFWIHILWNLLALFPITYIFGSVLSVLQICVLQLNGNCLLVSLNMQPPSNHVTFICLKSQYFLLANLRILCVTHPKLLPIVRTDVVTILLEQALGWKIAAMCSRGVTVSVNVPINEYRLRVEWTGLISLYELINI